MDARLPTPDTRHPVFVLLFEDPDARPRRRLLTLLGVPVEATRLAWLGPVFWLALGAAVGLAGAPAGASRLASGLAYGAALVIANSAHTLGHVLAGRLAGAPLSVVILTSTRDVSRAPRGAEPEPVRRRLARTLGGPVANLVVGAAALAFSSVSPGYWLPALGLVNVAVGLWTLCPVPGLDGRVLWGMARRAAPRVPAP